MTDSLSLFGNTPSTTSSVAPQEELLSSTPSHDTDVETFMQQLMQETGCSAEEAGEAYLKQLSKKKEQETGIPEGSYFKMDAAQKAEYMKRIRTNAVANTYIPPQLKELEQSDVNVANAQAQFMQNMRSKATNTNQAAIDFFRNYGKK